MDLNKDIANALVDKTRDQGLLLNAPRPATLRFMPALNVNDAEIKQMLAMLDSTLRELAGG